MDAPTLHPAAMMPGHGGTSDWNRIGGVPCLHVARAGVGTPLLLVHGIGPGTDGAANFAPLIAALPGDWPLHMVDLAGFGGSADAGPAERFDVALWLEQIEDALGQIGEPALLVGNSVGGALALKLAARRTSLRAVVAIGAPAAPMTATAALRAFWTRPATRAALAAAMCPMTAGQSEPPADVVEARWSAFADAGYAHRFEQALADPDTLLAAVALSADEANRITVPVHIIHGRQDRACPAPPLVRLLMEALQGVDATLLADCGHNVLWERTEDVVRILTALRKGEARP